MDSINPGSYNDFVEKNGLQTGAEAQASHNEAIANYRQQLAEFHGKSLEDLHTTPLSILAERATQLGLWEL